MSIEWVNRTPRLLVFAWGAATATTAAAAIAQLRVNDPNWWLPAQGTVVLLMSVLWGYATATSGDQPARSET